VKITSKLINFSLSAFLLAASSTVAAQEATSLSGLLNLVEGDKVSESAEYRARLQEFEQNAARQAQILETTKERITEQERTQGQLSDQFEANEITISDKREVLRDRRGDLNELFGTLQGVAGDFLSNFENSLISAQYPGRSEYIEGFIEKAGSTIEQLDVGEIERFWYFMQQEMTESARVVTYQGEVALPTGETATRSITRIGSFNSISEGEYLSYAGNIGHLQVLPKQPDAGTLSMASDLEGATSGFTKVGIDPTGGVGGQVMANLVNFPSVEEQVRNNSGTIGFIIIGVGIIGIILGFYRLLMLELTSAKVRSQLKSNTPAKNNPLGRATIAPLGGLLGTVTGMIQVFQQITVYGAGDPTIMAGGISQALMTTVLGIVVAIPTIFMHTVVKSRADNIIHILEEQATGMIAQKAEQQAAAR